MPVFRKGQGKQEKTAAESAAATGRARETEIQKDGRPVVRSSAAEAAAGIVRTSAAADIVRTSVAADIVRTSAAADIVRTSAAADIVRTSAATGTGKRREVGLLPAPTAGKPTAAKRAIALRAAPRAAAAAVVPEAAAAPAAAAAGAARKRIRDAGTPLPLTAKRMLK